ncbi:MAG: TlpA family protein disulfide reductase [Actinobacteria bacterium]|nr:TlpA family protein disulfide reductase [Actinomycetota bacterium]
MASTRAIRRAVLVFVPVVAFIGLLAYGLTTSAPNRIGPGSQLPDFELTRLDRDGVLTADELKGHPVVINFWASWCIPCREEADVLQETYEEYRDEGVVFVGVNIKDSIVGAKEFIDEFGVTYPTVRDPDEDLARELGVVGIPETFFIDADGVFVGSAAGRPLDKEQGVQRLGPVSKEVLTTNIDILLRRT